MTNDVSGAVKAAKSGRVDFKIDKTAIVHVGLGKVWKISITANSPSDITIILDSRAIANFFIYRLIYYNCLCYLQVNFTEESLRENIGAFVHALLLAKPVGLKKSK